MAYITIDAETKDGTRVEALVDASSPPAFGAWFNDEGRKLRRVVSVPQPPRVKNYEFVGRTLPNKKHALKQGRALAKQYDSKGRAVFDTKAEVREYLSRANDNPNDYNYEWDPDGGLGDD